MKNEFLDKIRENIGKVVVGMENTTDLVLICLVCGGHALIEDVPGLGKTTLVSALADSIDCSFKRIQFTPDIMPSDVVGYNMIDFDSGERKFYAGAVMNQIILADEINRTSPKTQSALLEAMQESNVTVDGETYELPAPFIVFATQNPVEMTGTYPLPEAQLDRFLLRISVGYPEKNNEIAILEKNREKSKRERLSPVARAEDVLLLQEELNNVKCVHSVMNYIVEIARRTREHNDVALGISPRGSIALMRASMGYAMISGRDYVLPDDVQKMLAPALAHRIVMQSQAYIQNRNAKTVLDEIIRAVPVPAMTAKT